MAIARPIAAEGTMRKVLIVLMATALATPAAEDAFIGKLKNQAVQY